MDFFGDAWLASRVLVLVPVVLSLSVHEFAHAFCAFRLGDDTAARQGRLTLNPLAHIDPVGLLLPLLGVPFGWARPVPIDPSRMRGASLEAGIVLTAAAGPLSNVLLAIGATLAMGVWTRLDAGAAAAAGPLWQLLEWLVLVNLLLAVFNLIPVPPLDGSRIVDGLCPAWLRPHWEAFARVGPFALVALLLVPALLGVSPIAGPVAGLQNFLDALYDVVAG
ncbi:MAG TPA: site-2 protease family protein [Myxococcota bacterium]|nr:site-2 protease family protein [Myxococcota bacterium]